MGGWPTCPVGVASTPEALSLPKCIWKHDSIERPVFRDWGMLLPQHWPATGMTKEDCGPSQEVPHPVFLTLPVCMLYLVRNLGVGPGVPPLSSSPVKCLPHMFSTISFSHLPWWRPQVSLDTFTPLCLQRAQSWLVTPCSPSSTSSTHWGLQGMRYVACVPGTGFSGLLEGYR